MNFKGWEKVEDDGKTAKLRHEKGHEMVIAIKALPRLQQEAIKRLKMAKGGDVLESEDGDGISTQGKDVRHAHQMKHNGHHEKHDEAMDYAKREAKGRAELEKVASRPNLKGLADGGEVRKEKGFWDSEHGKQALAAQNKEVENIAQRGENIKAGKENPKHEHKPPHIGAKIKHYADGSPDEVQADDGAHAGPPDQSQDQNQPMGGTHITINAAPAPSAAPAPAPVMQAPSQSAPIAPQQPEVPEAKSVAPSGGGVQQESQNSLNAINQGQAGIQGQAQVEAAKAQAIAPAEAEAVKSLQDVAATKAEALNDVQKHADDLKKYVDQHPTDINRFLNNRTAGTKIANGIGLFLGGLGVPFGGHNFALDFLNDRIKEDVAAQAKDTENRKSVFNAYQQLYGDKNVSAGLAEASIKDVLAHKISLAAVQLGTPQAKVNANFALQKLGQESNALRVEAAGALANKYHSGQMPANGSQPSNAKPSAGSAAPAKPNPKDHPLQGSILHPGAEAAFQALQYAPKAKDQIPEITRQFTQAQQADKALKQVNDTFLHLSQGAEAGGWSGRAHRGMNPHAVAGIGGAAGAGIGALAGGVGAIPGAGIGAAIGEGIGHLGQAATNTDVNRRYDAEQSNLKGYISAALKGTNIGSGDIDDIVAKNSPDFNDSPKTLATKLKTIRDFIKNHTETSLLKTWHLTDD